MCPHLVLTSYHPCHATFCLGVNIKPLLPRSPLVISPSRASLCLSTPGPHGTPAEHKQYSVGVKHEQYSVGVKHEQYSVGVKHEQYCVGVKHEQYSVGVK